MNQQGLARQVMIKQACAAHVNPICNFALLHFLTDIKGIVIGSVKLAAQHFHRKTAPLELKADRHLLPNTQRGNVGECQTAQGGRGGARRGLLVQTIQYVSIVF